MRILAIDFGRKKIGLAVSDPMNIIARGVATIIRRNLATDLEEIRKLVDSESIDKIVVGFPLNMDGTKSSMSEEVERFASLLRTSILDAVVLWDERLTSVQAERILIEANHRRERRKKEIDRLAAELILQCYLDSLTTTIE
jgi:putative holliday junction resolvase